MRQDIKVLLNRRYFPEIRRRIRKSAGKITSGVENGRFMPFFPIFRRYEVIFQGFSRIEWCTEADF
jgi:hypothetical protein